MKAGFELEHLTEDWDAQYFDVSRAQSYSPSTSDLRPLGIGVTVSQANALDDVGDGFTVHVPRPPSPSRGGKVGANDMLGWSNGINPDRSMHQRFTGKVLRVGSMGAHPVYGPVGFSNRQGKLDAAIVSQYTEYVPTPEEVGNMLMRPSNNDTVLREWDAEDE